MLGAQAANTHPPLARKPDPGLRRWLHAPKKARAPTLNASWCYVASYVGARSCTELSFDELDFLLMFLALDARLEFI